MIAGYFVTTESGSSSEFFSTADEAIAWATNQNLAAGTWSLHYKVPA